MCLNSGVLLVVHHQWFGSHHTKWLVAWNIYKICLMLHKSNYPTFWYKQMVQIKSEARQPVHHSTLLKSKLPNIVMHTLYSHQLYIYSKKTSNVIENNWKDQNTSYVPKHIFVDFFDAMNSFGHSFWEGELKCKLIGFPYFPAHQEFRSPMQKEKQRISTLFFFSSKAFKVHPSQIPLSSNAHHQQTPFINYTPFSVLPVPVFIFQVFDI